MIIPSTPILANGKVFTRNSVAVRLNGIIRLPYVDSLEWNDEKPHELVQAMNSGGVPLGKAEGNYNCGASISIFAPFAPQFEAAILAGSPEALLNLSAASFQMVIGMSEGIVTSSATWVNCNIVGRPTRSVSNDGSAIVKQYQIQPIYIIEDGKTLLNLLPSL